MGEHTNSETQKVGSKSNQSHIFALRQLVSEVLLEKMENPPERLITLATAQL